MKPKPVGELKPPPTTWKLSRMRKLKIEKGLASSCVLYSDNVDDAWAKTGID